MCCIALLTAAVLAVAAPQDPDTPTVVDAGALRLEIHLSRTAHLFHIVDQISLWSEYCHSQYRTAFVDAQGALRADDQAMLDQHKLVRKQREWGRGLEQAFYTPLDLDAALTKAEAAGQLTAEQARIEREVFGHFAARIDKLLADDRPRLLQFSARIQQQQDHLQEFAAKVSRFCGGARVTVPTFLIANPADRDFGGGFNGGRLTLEIPRQYDAMPSLLHEVMHAFITPHEEELTKAVAGVPRLDYQTINEGIAYALAPGIYQPTTSTDPLAADVARDLAAGSRLEGLVRFRQYGLALRPLLRTALADEHATLQDFVPRAIDAWRVLTELDAARQMKAKH